ncbi:39S ribosomal protein L47, mitochondrial, partial [Thoreauomyces humboldtii]
MATLRPFSTLSRCFSSSIRAALASTAPTLSRPTAAPSAATPARAVVTGLQRGLEDFFESDKGWAWSETEVPTGRAWLASELRTKSFEDMHSLWWMCIKEQNRLYSQKEEARRFQLYFPHRERMYQVKTTMKRIKLVLWERRIEWFRAQAVLKREEAASKLRTEGLEETEIERRLKELFPVAIKDIGRKPSKVKEEATNLAKIGETKGRTRRKKSDKSS